MRFTFTFNGISNEDMGVIVPNRPPLSSPRRRMQFSNVDGKYGSTSFDMGHEVYTTEFEIVVDSEDVMDSVLAWLRGPGKFTRSDRPGMYQNVYIKDDLHFAYIADHGDNRLYKGTLKLLALDVYWYRDGWFKPWGANLIPNGWESFVPYGFGEYIGKAPEDVFDENYTPNQLLNTSFKSNVDWVETNANIKPKENYAHLELLGGSYPRVHQNINGSTDIYYLRAEYLLENYDNFKKVELAHKSSTYFDVVDIHRGANIKIKEWTILSGLSSNLTQFTLRVEVYDVDVVSHISWRNPMAVNLTKLFGKGNEPSKEWCDENLKYYPNWQDLTDEEKPVNAYEKGYIYIQSVEGGLTRVRTRGGEHGIKLLHPKSGRDEYITTDVTITNNRSDTYVVVHPNTYGESIDVGPLDTVRVLTGGIRTVSNADLNTMIRTKSITHQLDFTANDPKVYVGKGEVTWEADLNHRIVNEGTAVAKPVIKLTKNKDSKAIVKIGSKTLEYNFPKEENEVYIDTKELKVYNSKGERRDIYFSTFEFPELPPGPTVVDNRSDVEVEFKHKDAWL